MGCFNPINSCIDAYDNYIPTPGDGIPGPNAKNQFLSIEVDSYNVELNTTPVPIEYDTILAQRGSHIRANVPTTDISLKANHTYLISYTVNGQVIVGTATLNVFITLDGVKLNASELSTTKETGLMSVSYTTILETGTSDSIMRVNVVSEGGTPRVSNSVVDIVEIK